MRPIPAATRLIAAAAAASLAGLSGTGQATAGTQHAASARVPGGLGWTSLYSPTTGGAGTAIAVSPPGSTVFAAGDGPGAGQFVVDFVTVAYNPQTGSQVWASQYRGPGVSIPTAVAVSPDGSRVFVTGSSEGDGTNRDWATVAYNAATGQHVWVRRCNVPGHAVDYLAGIVAAPNGTAVFVTGLSQGAGSGRDYTTIAYDAATGKQLWLRRYNNPRRNGYDAASALAISPDGNRLYVTGTSIGRSSEADYATVAYAAASGRQEWVARYNGHANKDDSAQSVAVSPDGRKVFVTGSSWSRSSVSGPDYAELPVPRPRLRRDQRHQAVDYPAAAGRSPQRHCRRGRCQPGQPHGVRDRAQDIRHDDSGDSPVTIRPGHVGTEDFEVPPARSAHAPSPSRGHGCFKIVLGSALADPGRRDVTFCRDLVSERRA